jgi:hypothetical protein
MIKFCKKINEGLNLPKKEKFKPIRLKNTARDGKHEYAAFVEPSDTKWMPFKYKSVLKLYGIKDDGQIYPTPGQWYVDTLLGRGDISLRSGRIGDTISIDTGQGWSVEGMSKIMDEILELEKNGVIPGPISEGLNLPKKNAGYKIGSKIKIKPTTGFDSEYLKLLNTFPWEIIDYSSIDPNEVIIGYKTGSSSGSQPIKKTDIEVINEGLNLRKKPKEKIENILKKYDQIGRGSATSSYGVDYWLPIDAKKDLDDAGITWYEITRVTNNQHPDYGKQIIKLQLFHGPGSGLQHLVREHLNIIKKDSVDLFTDFIEDFFMKNFSHFYKTAKENEKTIFKIAYKHIAESILRNDTDTKEYEISVNVLRRFLDPKDSDDVSFTIMQILTVYKDWIKNHLITEGLNLSKKEKFYSFLDKQNSNNLMYTGLNSENLDDLKKDFIEYISVDYDITEESQIETEEDRQEYNDWVELNQLPIEELANMWDLSIIKHSKPFQDGGYNPNEEEGGEWKILSEGLNIKKKIGHRIYNAETDDVILTVNDTELEMLSNAEWIFYSSSNKWMSEYGSDFLLNIINEFKSESEINETTDIESTNGEYVGDPIDIIRRVLYKSINTHEPVKEGLNLKKKQKPINILEYKTQQAMSVIEFVVNNFPDLENEWLETTTNNLKIALYPGDDIWFYIRYNDDEFSLEPVTIDGNENEESLTYYTYNLSDDYTFEDASRYMIQDIQHYIQNNNLNEGLNLPKKDLNTPEKWFKDLLRQMEPRKFEKRQNSIFYIIDNDVYMEQDLKTGYLWVNYNKIWSIFDSEFDIGYGQIQDLIKGMVEEHFKTGSLTPKYLNPYGLPRWENISKRGH